MNYQRVLYEKPQRVPFFSLSSEPVPTIQPLNEPLVNSTIRVYSTITSQLLPTPAKCHYTFNLRDLSKVFQGILMAEAGMIEVERSKTESDVIASLYKLFCSTLFQV